MLKQRCTKSFLRWTLIVAALCRYTKTKWCRWSRRTMHACHIAFHCRGDCKPFGVSLKKTTRLGAPFRTMNVLVEKKKLERCFLFLTCSPQTSWTIWTTQRSLLDLSFVLFFACNTWLLGSSINLCLGGCPPVVTEDSAKVQIGVWQSIGSRPFCLAAFGDASIPVSWVSCPPPPRRCFVSCGAC